MGALCLVLRVGVIGVAEGQAGSPRPDPSPAPRGADLGGGGAAPSIPGSAACEPANRGDKIEPLSNGLRIGMSRAQVVSALHRRGEPPWNGRIVRDESVEVELEAEGVVRRITVRGPVCLSSGIGVGSTKAEVRSVFGGTYQIVLQGRRLTFDYGDDRVRTITIERQ